MVNGSPTDSNAAQFARGRARRHRRERPARARRVRHAGLEPREGAGVGRRARSRSTATRSPGVYAANDGIAGGAISALQGGATCSRCPIVTGQDAELSAIQRILTGDQHMTVYKAIKPQAELAAEVAVALLEGEEVDGAAGDRGHAGDAARPRRGDDRQHPARPSSPTDSGPSTTSARPPTPPRATPPASGEPTREVAQTMRA